MYNKTAKIAKENYRNIEENPHYFGLYFILEIAK